MGFLNPLMLFGIAAVSVPIIIHLLNRRKYQRIVWAAMRFLKASVQQNQRRIHLEDIALLIIRCLLVALLAFTLARPAIKSEATGILGAKTTRVIIIDNSYSMSLSDGTTDIFTRACKTADEIISKMEPGSSSALFLASDVVKPVIPEPTYDVNLLRKTLGEARVSGRSSDLMPSIKQAIATLKTIPSIRREIYIITDGQYLAWKNFKEIQNLLEEAKRDNIQITIIIAGEEEERNLGISRFSIASGLAPINQPIRFEVQVSNYGQKEENNIKVSINIDDNPPCDEIIIDSIAPGASKTVSLFGKFYSDAFHSVTAKISGDRLPYDDTRSLVVRTVKEVRVLLVDGNPGAEPREGQSFYLKHALQPVPPAEEKQYFLKPTIVTTKELTNVKFDDYDVVFLLDVPEFLPQTLSALEFFVKRGGGLVVFPGPQTISAYYNNVVFEKYRLLPAMFGKLKGSPEKQETYLNFQDKNYSHPVVEIWNDPASGTLSSARFYAAYDLLIQDIKNSGKTTNGNSNLPGIIINYNDGKPAIVEKTIDFGRVVQFSSTANTMWNDLPVRPAFVPLIHRIVGYIMSGQYENLTIKVGDPFIYRVSNDYLGKDVMVVPPGATTNSPRQLSRVELLNELPAIQFNETDFSGVYQVSIAGETLNPIKFAAQSDAIESTLERLSKQQLDLIAQNAKVLRWKPGISINEEIQKSRFGIELWIPILIVVLLLAVIESALAQYFSKTK